jgi:putative ABC transport system permease protein
MIFRNIKFAWEYIIEGKLKSLLSIISIAISVITLISILSISHGLSKYIENQFGVVGVNLMWIESDASKSNSDLRLENVDNIGNLSFVDAISPRFISSAKIYEENNMGSIAVCGVNKEYASITNLLVTGEFISDTNCNCRNAVCVISEDVRKKYVYRNINPIGEQIKIGGMYYTIIGYVDSNVDSTGFAQSTEPSNAVYIPYTTFQNNYSNVPLNYIVFQAQDASNIKEYTKKIDGILSANRNKSLSYKVRSVVTQMDSYLTFIDKINGFFITFIIITMLISGIGIMNVMLMSTMEKKWEIGLRQSFGASRVDIQLQFMFEIIILAVTGAALGICGGILVVTALSAYVITMSISIKAVVLSIVFSFIVSFIFGWIPAIRASRLKPLDCLKKE